MIFQSTVFYRFLIVLSSSIFIIHGSFASDTPSSSKDAASDSIATNKDDATVPKNLVTLPTNKGKIFTGRIVRRAPNHMPDFKPVDDLTSVFHAPIKTTFDYVKESGDLLSVWITEVGDDHTSDLVGGRMAAIPEDKKVRLGYEYQVSNNDLKGNMVTHGLTTGVLFVPFKYHLSDNTLTSGSTTIGPYLGYETGWLDTANLTIFGSFGINSFSLQSQSSSQTTTNYLGLSFAVGIALDAFDVVKVMYTCGQDSVTGNSSAQYQYNNQWWCMAGIGYGL